MIRLLTLLIAVVVLWALMTSGISIGDVIAAVLNWAANHIQITVR